MLRKYFSKYTLIIIGSLISILLIIFFIPAVALIIALPKTKQFTSYLLLYSKRNTPLEAEVLSDAVTHFQSQQIYLSWLAKLIPSAKLQQINLASQTSLNLLSDVDRKLQQGEEYRILLLFQNNYELRPTGGFTGSYGELIIRNNQPLEFYIQDIYVPDGQLTGHVDPPPPIQQAFEQGFWKLRDANWHPNLAQTMERINWFFANSIETDYDAALVTHFSTVENLLEITGPVELPDGQIVDQQSLYPLLQRLDQPFTPGSTLKRDTLLDFSTGLQLKLQSLNQEQQFQLLDFLTQARDEKQIMLWAKHQKTQNYFNKLHWTSALSKPENADYFAIIEANLGINKANCCVERNIKIYYREPADKHTASITKSISVNYFHPAGQDVFQSVDGTYKSFVRLYLHPDAQISNLKLKLSDATEYLDYPQFIDQQIAFGNMTKITTNQPSVDQVNGLSELGFWVVVPQDQQLEVSFDVTVPKSEIRGKYQLYIYKQPGLSTSFNQYSISQGKFNIFSGTLDQDQLLKIDKY